MHFTDIKTQAIFCRLLLLNVISKINANLNIFSTVQILDNVQIKADLKKGQKYFQGSVTFMKTLNQILDMLVDAVSILLEYI